MRKDEQSAFEQLIECCLITELSDCIKINDVLAKVKAEAKYQTPQGDLFT